MLPGFKMSPNPISIGHTWENLLPTIQEMNKKTLNHEWRPPHLRLEEFDEKKKEGLQPSFFTLHPI